MGLGSLPQYLQRRRNELKRRFPTKWKSALPRIVNRRRESDGDIRPFNEEIPYPESCASRTSFVVSPYSLVESNPRNNFPSPTNELPSLVDSTPYSVNHQGVRPLAQAASTLLNSRKINTSRSTASTLSLSTSFADTGDLESVESWRRRDTTPRTTPGEPEDTEEFKSADDYGRDVHICRKNEKLERLERRAKLDPAAEMNIMSLETYEATGHVLDLCDEVIVPFESKPVVPHGIVRNVTWVFGGENEKKTRKADFYVCDTQLFDILLGRKTLQKMGMKMSWPGDSETSRIIPRFKHTLLSASYWLEIVKKPLGYLSVPHSTT